MSIKILVLREITTLLFNLELKVLIENNKAMAVCDASVKNRKMGDFWTIINMNK